MQESLDHLNPPSSGSIWLQIEGVLRPEYAAIFRYMPIRQFNHLFVVLFLPLLFCCLSAVLSGCGASAVTSAFVQGILQASTNNLSFGQVPVGTVATASVSLVNESTKQIQIAALSITDKSFSVNQAKLPITINAGATYKLNVLFAPASVGSATAVLTIATNSSSALPIQVNLSGTGVSAGAVESTALACADASVVGPGTDNCVVKLGVAAPSGGTTVKLSSNNSAITVPDSVTVPAGSATASFTATAKAVTSTQSVTLTASAGTSSGTFIVQLEAPQTAQLTVSATSISFGSVKVDSASAQSLTLSSTGSAPVTVNAATVSGTGFSVSGVSFPLTLNPGQTSTLSVKFDPTAAGSDSGAIAFASNSSTGSAAASSTVVSLSGTGIPAASSLTCANASITGAATDNCTVTLNAAAASGGLTVNLASNNSAVAVPSSVKVPQGSASASFTATAKAVASAQAATLTASTSNSSASLNLQLNAATSTLGISTASIAFGNVAVNTTATHSLTLTSTGTVAVTVSSAAVAGTGYTISGATFPLILNPGQTATLAVQFDPTIAGSDPGSITFTSNSANNTSSNSTTRVALSGAGIAPLGSLACANASITGAATDNCTVTLRTAAGADGQAVALSSSNSAVSVPASITVPAGSTSAAFTATATAVSSAQTATLTATYADSSLAFTLHLAASNPALTVSSSSIAFGDVTVNTAATQPLTLKSTGTSALTIGSVVVSGAGFSTSGATFPLTLNPGQSATLAVKFNPATAGSVSGSLTITSNTAGKANTVTAVALAGTGAPAPGSLACASTSITGAGTDSCVVTLNTSAPSGGTAVKLTSSNSAVTIPATVTVPAGSTTAAFTATATAVSSAQTATLTATAGSASMAFALQLQPGGAELAVSASSISFGNVAVNTAVTQSLTLSSTGTAALTISSAAITGTGYTFSGAAFPLTLNVGQSAKLTIQFDPTAVGSDTGALTFTSNSATGGKANPTTVVTLSGTGAAPSISSLTCANSSITGAGTDICTITLNTKAASGGTAVTLASNNSSVTVPASVTVASGATTAAFSAKVASVTSTQTAILTATAGGVSKTFSLQLGSSVPTLTVSSTSITFGDVSINTASTQSLILSSTGSAAVTISSATASGTGFSVSGATFPLTLNPSQTATLEVQFEPTAAGSDTGALTIVSTSSSNPTARVVLTGTGTSTSYQVQLSWNAPSSSSDPVTGYNIYRSPSGAGSYQLLNSSPNAGTNYNDTTITNGQSYDYYVESVDASGNQSVPSNTTTVSVP